MKKQFLFSIILLALGFSQMSQAQTKEPKKYNPEAFDEEAALAKAKAQGIKASELKGYVQYLKNDFSSQNALKKQAHICTPYEGGIASPNRVIYTKPNSPTSIGCPNASFEQYNFVNWTGSNGTYSGPLANPVYVMANGIINSAGINTPLANTTNYQTLMTTPPSNPIYPNCVGYDSIAARVIGTQTVSEIPFISPYSLDGVSCRLLGGYGGANVSRLKYVMSVGPNSRAFRYSYAVVLTNESANGGGYHQPYLLIKLKDQNGTPILGCNDFNEDAIVATTDTAFRTSHLIDVGYPIRYKRWSLVTVDLSAPIYNSVTSLSIEFEVAGCTGGSHLGYAYVDAECASGGVSMSFCSGPNAVLAAPVGFNSYQWQTMPGNTPIAGATNDSLIVPNATVGDVFAVQMTSPGGCTLTITDTIKPTSINLTGLNSAPSCAGGYSGLATVMPVNGSGVYTYTWTNTSTGAVVSNSQTATGLAPGNYAVNVNDPICGGTMGGSLSVGTSPPFFITQTKSYCGSYTFITPGSGTNFHWYGATSPSTVVTQISTNDTLFVSVPVVGGIYTLVYNNTFGCKDSIRYTLTLAAGGNTYLSNINNVCPSNTNGSAILHISTILPTPYTYSVVGTGGTIVSNTPTTSTVVTIPALAAGSYTVASFDGLCYYNNTFTITTIQTNFTITPTNTVVCYPSDTAMLHLNFGSSIPAGCSVDAALCSGGSPTTLFNVGPFTQNGAANYPTPYGNYYTYGKHQFLIQKADLNAAGISAGKISSLAFNILNMNSSIVSYPNFSIKMGCTNLTALPNASVTNTSFNSALLSTVYSSASQPISLGWVTHNFNQSYVWDGVSNLIVEVCFGMNTPSTYNFNGNASIELKQMPYIATMFHVEDTNPVCSGTQLANNGWSPMTNAANMLPNMRFGYCGAVNPSTYTVSTSNGSITVNYSNDSIKIVPPSTFVVPATNTPYIYTISVTNPNGGCVKTQTVAILYPAPITSITAIPNNTTVCEGSQLALTSTGAVTYTWAYGSISNTVATTQSVVVTPPSTGLNTYIVTGVAPCGALPDTKTVTVNVIPKANLLISPLQDVTKCLNKNYVVTTGVGSATPGNTGTPYTYAWTTLPTNAPASGVNTSSNYTVTSNTTATLVVTVNGSCANTGRDTIVIKNFVNNLAVAIIDSSTTCAGTEFTLHSTVTGGYPTYNYGWFIDSNTSPLSTSANLVSISPANQGMYTIVLYVNDSCGYNATAFEVIKVLPPCNVVIPNVITPNGDGVNDYFRIANIEHHPNTNVTLFDRWGRKVYENANYNNDWKADHLSDGTYFYVVDVPNDKKYSGFITVFHNK